MVNRLKIGAFKPLGRYRDTDLFPCRISPTMHALEAGFIGELPADEQCRHCIASCQLCRATFLAVANDRRYCLDPRKSRTINRLSWLAAE